MNPNRVNIHIDPGNGGQWCHYSSPGCNIWVKGFAYRDETLFMGDQLVRELRKRVDCRKSAVAFIAGLNGSFSIILEAAVFCLAAVDHYRSIPLFYHSSDQVYISNNPYWIRDRIDDPSFDEKAVLDFSLTGYVTGNRTLCSGIKQITDGQILQIRKRKNYGVAFLEYHKNISKENLHWGEEELLEKFDRILRRAFKRFVNSIGDKTVVVPLSAGYDSYLIILMLRELGVKNVICYSYGRNDYFQAKVSRKRSEAFGYKWLFVPYDRKSWTAWQETEEWKLYCEYAHHLNTIPHLQDWPAVMQLKNNRLIPEDSVFVPGHTVTLKLSQRPASLNPGEPFESILAKHYTLWDWGLKRDQIKQSLIEGIMSAIGPADIETYPGLVAAYESWEWKERQIKFIVNSVRAYEFFGYDWRLPLWDRELVDFWQHVPLCLRVDKRLMKKAIFRYELGDNGYEKKVEASVSNGQISLVSIVRDYIRKMPILFYLVNKLDLRPRGVFSYWNYPYCFTGHMKFMDFWKHYHYGLNANSLLMKSEYIDNPDYNLPDDLTKFFRRFVSFSS